MIGLDTNILLRLFVDDGDDTQRVRTFFAKASPDETYFISGVVLVEFIWTLRARYRFAREELRVALSSLLENDEIQIENAPLVREAYELSLRANADFPDAFVALSGREAGCRTTMTLDRRAGRRLPHMDSLP